MRIAKLETETLWKEWKLRDLWRYKRKFFTIEVQEVESIMGLAFTQEYRPERGWGENLKCIRCTTKSLLINELKFHHLKKRDRRKLKIVEDISMFPSYGWNGEQVLIFEELKKEVTKILSRKPRLKPGKKPKEKNLPLRIWNIVQMQENGDIYIDPGEARSHLTSGRLAKVLGGNSEVFRKAWHRVGEIVKEVSKG